MDNGGDELDVSKMGLIAAFNWLKKNKIKHHLHSLEEMRKLIHSIRGSSAATELSLSALSESESDLSEVFRKDKDIRDRIGSLYETILQTINSTDLCEYLSEWCGCRIEDHLNKIKDELQRMDCPIVIAGETSAGKSCFLNLILGDDILPVSLLCATATICVVHPISPKETPYFVVDGQKHEGSKEELKGKLKIKLTSRSETDTIEQVDIYWQVPLIGLNKHIVFVDTPGIGESKQMTDKLFKYLPNAAAFIYIINAANAGGVQEDKLVKIFKKVLEYDHSSDLFCFDPTCTLFVCNKWDIVADRVRKDGCNEKNVWDDIASKLRKYVSEESQYTSMYKMSTTEAIRYAKSGMGDSTFYAELKDGLKRLAVQSLTSKSKMHTRWIENMLDKINTFMSGKNRHSDATTEEKVQLQHQMDTKLKNIEQNTNEVRTTLLEKCTQLSVDMGRALDTHLRKKDVYSRIEAGVQQIRAPDDDAFQYLAKKQIMRIIVEEIDSWEKEELYFKKTTEHFLQKIEEDFTILDEQCIEAETAFDNTEQLLKARTSISAGSIFKDKRNKPMFRWLLKWEFKRFDFKKAMGSVVAGYNYMAKLLNREQYMRTLLEKVLQSASAM